MQITILSNVNKIKASINSIFGDEFIGKSNIKFIDQVSIEFLSILSKNILAYKNINLYPELVALAYWLRKANILRITKNFVSKETSETTIKVPRGIAFHVAPSNVDSIFLYSWALSLLVGNKNIIRISQRGNNQMTILTEIVSKLFNEKKWHHISERNFLIQYDHNEKINEYLSSISDLRVLWGGDQTVQLFKKILAKPTTLDITFADKFSYSVVNADYYNKQTVAQKKQLANKFYNDSYWFDQMACSSPRIVFFVGKNIDSKANQDFWNYLEEVILQKQNYSSESEAMNKLVHIYEMAAKNIRIEKIYEIKNYKPTILKVNIVQIKGYKLSCGSGLFLECSIDSLDRIIPIITLKDQTLTYYGFNKEILYEFVNKINGKGVDRVVPIGEGLAFNQIWDGYSIFDSFSKIVSIL